MYEEMFLEKTLIDRLLSSNENFSGDSLVDSLNSLEPPEISYSEDEIDVTLKINKSGYICHIPGDYPFESFDIFNLDPGTAAALIAGLSTILAWVSTERRHKKNLTNNQPPAPPVKEITYSPHKESCSYLDENKICGLPFLKTARIKGQNFLIILKACTNKPTPHTTCEYYGL